MIKGSFIIFLLIVTINVFAQFEPIPFYNSTELDSVHAGELFFSVENKNLLRNNEFFNNIVPGFTIFGSLLNATIKYRPAKNFQIEGGLHFLKYFGENNFSRVVPLLRVQYEVIPNLQVIMGNIYGGLNHRFVEPLYRFDRFLEDPPETGIQFLFKTPDISSDLYINWEHYLHRDGYNDKEQFTMGWVNDFSITRPGNPLQIHIPVQFLGTHSGGQIDTLHFPVVSILNYVAGITFGIHFSGWLKEAGLKIYGLSYRELTASGTMPYEKGNAFFPLIYTGLRWADLHLGYWKSNKFIAPKGEPLYSSISLINPGMNFPFREMILFKLNIHHKIARGIWAGVRYEGFWDLKGTQPGTEQSHYDFSYGGYINFSEDFFLKKRDQ